MNGIIRQLSRRPRARISAALGIAVLLLPGVALAVAGNEPPDWDRLARSLHNPSATLGLAADIGTQFANVFWRDLDALWQAMALVAILTFAFMWFGGFLQGPASKVAPQMFLAMIILVAGMMPVEHTTYVTDDPTTLFYEKPGNPSTSDTSGNRVSYAPALLEYATYIGIWGHRLIGSAIDDAFSGNTEALGSEVAIASAAHSQLNDATVARQIQGAAGNLPRAYLTYQKACANVLDRDPNVSGLSESTRVALALDGAAMTPPEKGSQAYTDIRRLNEGSGEMSAVKDAMKSYTPAFTGTRDAEGVPNSSRGVDTAVHAYPAYRIPTAEYWARRYGIKAGKEVEASGSESPFIDAVKHFGGQGEHLTLSHQQFPEDDFRAIVGENTPFAGKDVDDQALRDYFIPKNCWELYLVNRIGFNQLWQGYSTHFAVEQMGRDSSSAMCAARDIGNHAAEAMGLFGIGQVSDAIFGDSSQCSQKYAERLGLIDSSSVALGRAQAALVADPVGSPGGPDTAGEQVLDNVRAAYNSLTSGVSGLFQFFDLERNVPLLMGALAMAYGAVLMFFPFIAAFAVFPGQARLLALPLKVLLFVHVSLLITYAVLRAGAWLYRGLIDILSSGMQHAVLFESPYAKLLAGLPAMVSFIAGLGMTIAGIVIFSARPSVIGDSGKVTPPGTGGERTSSGSTVTAGAMIASRASTGPVGRAARSGGSPSPRPSNGQPGTGPGPRGRGGPSGDSGTGQEAHSSPVTSKSPRGQE